VNDWAEVLLRSRFLRIRLRPVQLSVALILTFGPVSGAHFNPAVTLADAWLRGGLPHQHPSRIPPSRWLGLLRKRSLASAPPMLPDLLLRSWPVQARPQLSFVGLFRRFRKMWTRSSPHDQAEALMHKKRVLILCTGNSARSQMAEGLLRHDAGDRFEVFSAGTKPSHVRPEAIDVMRELDIDISGQRSKNVNEFIGQSFDYVLTVCDYAKESCPIFPGKTITIHRNFEDPAALQGAETERLALFRRVHEEMRQYLRAFPN
jgi:arsenate reductase